MAKPHSGDTVRLKSGSPVMTVESVEDYVEGPRAKCTWFVGPELRTALINVEALAQVTEKDLDRFAAEAVERTTEENLDKLAAIR